jgi:hypothetical protein
MHARTRDRTLFGVLAVAYTLFMLLIAYVVSQKVTLPDYVGAVIPVVAVMAAARGFRLQRKAIFIAITFGGLVIIGLIGEYLGLNQHYYGSLDLATVPLSTLLPRGLDPAGDPLVFPFLMLVAFVGRHPRRLWESKHYSRVRRSSSHRHHHHRHEAPSQEPAPADAQDPPSEPQAG